MPLTLRLGTWLLQTAEDEELRLLQSAVALLRTVFEDHYVDPDHQPTLFFHGRTLPGGPHDFTVNHRGGHVVLKEFTFPMAGPREMTLPLLVYASEIGRFARQVQGAEERPVARPEWHQRYAEWLRGAVAQLIALTERLVSEGPERYPDLCTVFYEEHGSAKRPLELQVKAVLEPPVAWEPVPVVARALFGPVRLGERIPMKLNCGDTILATISGFQPEGIHLLLEGVGHGGVCPGDRLTGLQLFYP